MKRVANRGRPPPQVFVRKQGRTVPRGRVDVKSVVANPKAPTKPTAKTLVKPTAPKVQNRAQPKTVNRRGVRPWITVEGSLGQGFLTTMSSADRKRALDVAVREYGYRTVLGKISVLQRSTVLQQKYGDALDEAHEYLVKKHGGPGSFGPQSNFGATLDERTASRMNRLKR